MRQFNVEGIERHADDQTSIYGWVEEMKEMDFNPVIIFKPQGVDSDENGMTKEDFLLGIQTEFQLEALKNVEKKLSVWMLHMAQIFMVFC